MTQNATGSVPDQEREEQLWIDYVVAQARTDEAWRLSREAWHEFVATGLKDPVKHRVWSKCVSLHRTCRDRAKAAFAAWERVAFPLHNLGYLLKDEAATVS